MVIKHSHHANRPHQRKGGFVYWLMLFLFCCVALWLCVVIMHLQPISDNQATRLRADHIIAMSKTNIDHGNEKMAHVVAPPVSAPIGHISHQETEETDDLFDDSYHLVFSTGCSEFQDWQSIGVYSSAEAVGQRGVITRIASGCKPEQEKAIRHAMSHLPKRCRVHFAPGTQVKDHAGHNYKYANKPLGMMHWLMHAGKKSNIQCIVL